MAYTPYNADWKDYPDVTTPITEAALEHIETGITNAAATADSAIAETVVAAKGDLIVATANDTVTNLTVGTDGYVLAAASGEATGLEWIELPTTQELLHYSAATANVTVTASAYTAATAVIAGSSVAYAARPILVEFYSPRIERTTGSTVEVGLYDSTTHIATIAYFSDGNGGHGVPVWAAHRFTPTAASHTYNIKAWGSGGNTTVYAGNGGGSGAYAPAFLRIRYDD